MSQEVVKERKKLSSKKLDAVWLDPVAVKLISYIRWKNLSMGEARPSVIAF